MLGNAHPILCIKLDLQTTSVVEREDCWKTAVLERGRRGFAFGMLAPGGCWNPLDGFPRLHATADEGVQQTPGI